jgi:sugar (pentulose or hexulose) kinase
VRQITTTAAAAAAAAATVVRIDSPDAATIDAQRRHAKPTPNAEAGAKVQYQKPKEAR